MQLGHTGALTPMLMLWLGWTITALVRIIPTVIVKMALQLLISRLRINVGDTGDFDTLILLIVSILESILVKVNRRRSEPLRCRLLIARLSELIR